MHHLKSLSIAALTAVSLVAVAGCSIGKIDPGTIDLGPSTSPIRYNADRSIETPIATGSTSTITVDVADGIRIASASTGDTTIASLGKITTLSAAGNSASFPISAKNAGSTPFVVLDINGKEVGRATIHVADTKAVQVDGADGLTLVSGASYTVHATTIGDDGVVLVGDGAIAFEASGSLVSSYSTGAFCLGDCGTFATHGIGDGQLHMVAKGASADRTFHVVDRASIDAITFATSSVSTSAADGGTILFSLFAGSTAVVPARDVVACTSANPLVVTIDSIGPLSALGNDSSGYVALFSRASGTTTVTCTVGSHAATATVTVP